MVQFRNVKVTCFRFMYSHIIIKLRLLKFSIHQGTSSIPVPLRKISEMLVEISGKLLNREQLVRSSMSRELRLMPLGRVSKFMQYLMLKLFSLLRLRNEEGSSTKAGISERYNFVEEEDSMARRGVSGLNTPKKLLNCYLCKQKIL